MEKSKSKYNSLEEWKKDFPIHYRDAKSQGHIEELCRIFGWDLPIIKEYHPRGYWDNKENCIEEAKKYKTISEWQNKSSGSYKAAKKNGWYDEITEHIMKRVGVKNGYWTKERCIEEAKKYNTITEWRNKSAGSYAAAGRNGWYNECSEHMAIERVKSGHWQIKENVLYESKKYKTISEWQNKSSSSYNVAKKNGWYNECTKHMIRKRVKSGHWKIKENCIEEAKKYKTIKEWRNKSAGSYAAAKKNGWYNECSEHMAIDRVKSGHWQIKENCIEEAKKYKTRKEWEKNSKSSYSTAGRNGWFDECTAHMVRKRVTKMMEEYIDNPNNN